MDNSNRSVLLVNSQDEIVGTEKALKAHFKTHLALHRAFSVFLFNSKGELLVQKRASGKLLFPNKWTNSVCSHPFANDLSFTDPLTDVKVHAVKRIEYELGIRDVAVDDLRFISRVVYKASQDERWGTILPGDPVPQAVSRHPDPVNLCESYRSEDFYEWEVDYIVFALSDMPPSPNPEEVSAIRYVSKDKFEEMMSRDLVSPWLDQISRLVDIFDIKKIHFPLPPSNNL